MTPFNKLYLLLLIPSSFCFFLSFFSSRLTAMMDILSLFVGYTFVFVVGCAMYFYSDAPLFNTGLLGSIKNGICQVCACADSYGMVYVDVLHVAVCAILCCSLL